MDIAALSSVMSQTALMNQVSTAVLSKSLDNMEVMGDGMKKFLKLPYNLSLDKILMLASNF